MAGSSALRSTAGLYFNFQSLQAADPRPSLNMIGTIRARCLSGRPADGKIKLDSGLCRQETGGPREAFERGGTEMRYVIAVCILTGLIIWDGVHHDGRYLDGTLGMVKSMVDSIARMV